MPTRLVLLCEAILVVETWIARMAKVGFTDSGHYQWRSNIKNRWSYEWGLNIDSIDYLAWTLLAKQVDLYDSAWAVYWEGLA